MSTVGMSDWFSHQCVLSAPLAVFDVHLNAPVF